MPPSLIGLWLLLPTRRLVAETLALLALRCVIHALGVPRTVAGIVTGVVACVAKLCLVFLVFEAWVVAESSLLALTRLVCRPLRTSLSLRATLEGGVEIITSEIRIAVKTP